MRHVGVELEMAGIQPEDMAAAVVETVGGRLEEADSRLAAILVTTRLRVNALHSQAIDQLGEDLRISARETSGVVQAIERGTQRFALGVQWHPEYLPQRPEQRALFRQLVLAARGAS